MAPEGTEGGGSLPGGAALRVGTWNMSHWSAYKAELVATTAQADILAIQETHLAPVPLEWAHSTARRVGLHLHHGRPAAPQVRSEHGRSCGVGFLCRQGQPVLPAIPSCPAWSRLASLRRLHGVRVAPRPGLPHGVLLLSVYAPLREPEPERAVFDQAFLGLVEALDMQVPTLLLGDFNGSLVPSRDYRGRDAARRPVCPLLAALLGPGAPWVDVHAALLGTPLPMTFRNSHLSGAVLESRIDLVLANASAMRLMRAASVQDGIRDGGHSPVLVSLALDPGRILWSQPRPRAPAWLSQPSATLRASPEWQALVGKWVESGEAKLALTPGSPHTLETLSAALLAALHRLVTMAGGWARRPARRRLAYDSDPIRAVRRRLALLHSLERLVARPIAGAASWPRAWLLQLEKLARSGLELPRSSLGELRRAIASACAAGRQQLAALVAAMRRERSARWRASLPAMWKERPGVITHWLQAEGVPWGSRPVLDAAGNQCLTPGTVDAAVRSFWVDAVLRQHAQKDEEACWAAFLASPFAQHVPHAVWPSSPWTGERVRAALDGMREGASPGSLGVPISVWRALPPAWSEAVARLLNLVEEQGRWPREWLQAYVAMIPKASGGSRPQDQRPVTVLEVLYRLWAKGVVQEWAPVLQSELLGQAAFGFRAQSGTLYAAQVLADIIRLHQGRKAELWLASFDLAKCFDSLPWWAVFRILRLTGVRRAVVDAFRDFYRRVRRRFRYGSVEGQEWFAANGLAQGCPASPDLLNILMEAFHRWALAEGLGVRVAGLRIPSVSFADDVALAADSEAGIRTLIQGYLDWCGLLGVQVTKVQVWTSRGPGLHLRVGELDLVSSDRFRFVGVELGLREPEASRVHLSLRLEKAVATTQRMRSLQLPASLCCLLWQTTVLPQALYGCEIRDIRPQDLARLSGAGKAAIIAKPPLRLNAWRAHDVAMGLPMGDSAVMDPVASMRLRQLTWLQVVANSTSLAGVVHRAVSCPGTAWDNPSPPVRSALKALGWTARRNVACLRAADWPRVAPEPRYPGQVITSPGDHFPLPGAVFTDGSLLGPIGGAAVWLPEEERVVSCPVPNARSSTECELVALCLALQLRPRQVLTDSLCALQLLRSWHSYGTRRVLRCDLRPLVRQVLGEAQLCAAPPVLEKVLAHNEAWIRLGHPMAVGNDQADRAAKLAAAAPTRESLAACTGSCGDAVEVLDAAGDVVWHVSSAFPPAWWARVRARTSRGPRPRLDPLFPLGLEVDWPASNGVFRRALAGPQCFLHTTAPHVIKWVARARCGCLATQARLFAHGMGVPSAACRCCGAAVEDDLHVLSGCPATGSLEWGASILEAWVEASARSKVVVPMPPQEWVSAHHIPLTVAVVPSSTLWHHALPVAEARAFCSRLHTVLAERLAELMRRRGELMAGPRAPVALPPLAGAVPAAPWVRGQRRACHLGAERRLSVAELRQAEVARRSTSSTTPLPSAAGRPGAAPAAGEPRQRWLRDRLVRLLAEETSPCPAAVGASAEELLALFETSTKEQYTPWPGAPVSRRVTGLGKALGNLAQGSPLDPPLLRAPKRGCGFVYSRTPKSPVDVPAWRRSQAGPMAVAMNERMTRAALGLGDWLARHKSLRPVAAEAGESGMALLILWEVDHGVPFPSSAGDSSAGLLMAFTKKLKAQVARHPDLQGWLHFRDVSTPLAPGVAPSYHTRWSVQIRPPPEGVEADWYRLFVHRWKAYLLSLAGPRDAAGEGASSSSAAAASASAGVPRRAGRRRERSPSVAEEGLPRRRRAAAPERPGGASQPPRSLPSAGERRPGSVLGPRAPDAPEAEPVRKRQATLASWINPRVAQRSPAHGRAVEGPPT